MPSPSNVDRVKAGLDILSAGLEPFIARVLAPHVPPGQDWTILLAIKDEVKGATGKTYSRTDVQVQLRTLTERFGDLGFPFKGELSRAQQNLAGELREVRNDWAHMRSFTTDDAYRALDTMERLLRAVGAAKDADKVRTLRLDVQRAGYERETRREARIVTAAPNTADADLPAWRDVLTPHPDVREGTFATSEFAADLYRVAVEDPTLEAEYRDPAEFFRRTHLTGGLRDLLTRSASRIRGGADANPVINLQDRFGGGKTHSMLAVWHLFSGKPLRELPQDVQDLLHDNDPTGTDVRRVTLVGNEIAPAETVIKPDGTRVRTLWGELAWQLGGAEGYALVAESDRAGTNPGSLLRDLLARYAPAVILIDEWVAYARQLYGRGDLPAGTFDTQFTFAQSLTQAVAAVPRTLLLVSIPASDSRAAERGDRDVSELEVGGEHGREALDRLNHVVRRVAYAWEPATPDESFEIVRRRLFLEPDNAATATINGVARRFLDYYRHNRAELPSGVTEHAYEQRIRTAYPIHPELLDRLYSDWSTLEKFQRTRGVLRLMSTVVHRLWVRGDRSPLIMPGSVPLDADGARGELVQYLDPRWAEIIGADIDGEHCASRAIDADRPLLGRRSTALRVARALFVDSAPTADSPRKGIDRKQITLGVVTPGDVLGNVGSALDGLANASGHLFRDGERYWYDTQPSLNRLAHERAGDLKPDVVHEEVIARLRNAVRGPAPDFAAIITAPESSAEIPDVPETRLVVLRPEHRQSGRDADSPAKIFAMDALRHRGSAPRMYTNSVVFLAADENRWRDLEANVRHHLAWRSIADDPALDLTKSNTAQVTRRIEETNRVIDDQVAATWIWGLSATQATPTAPLVFEQVRCDGTERKIAVRAGKKLTTADALRVDLGHAALLTDLKTSLRARWNEGHVSVGELWDWYSRYPYLVRLRDKRVLTERLRDVLFEPAWEQRGFALATGMDETSGDFTGLAVPMDDLDFGPVEDSSLLVRAEIAKEQRAREEAARAEAARDAEATLVSPPPTPGTGRGGPGTGGAGDEGGVPAPVRPVVPPTPPRPRNVRWQGRFEIDPSSEPGAQLTTIAKEVLDALRAAGPDVLEITLEVTADKHTGFDDHTVRTVSENARVLGADHSRFEDA